MICGSSLIVLNAIFISYRRMLVLFPRHTMTILSNRAKIPNRDFDGFARFRVSEIKNKDKIAFTSFYPVRLCLRETLVYHSHTNTLIKLDNKIHR